MFRPLTLIAALCVALLIYLAIAGLIVQRLNRMFFVTCLIGSSREPAPTVGIEGGRVKFLEHSAPLIAVMGTAAIPPIWWLASTVYAGNVRRTRELLGQCVECGEPLIKKRGRCPRCGERFEQNLSREPMTPVIYGKRVFRR